MENILQILTMIIMAALTYLLFRSIGPRRNTLLYSRSEKLDWDRTIGQSLGKWVTATNIVGTLTSLATAYLFFLGNSKLFGAWIFLCCITIWLGSFVTVRFTNRICSKPYVSRLIQSSEQVSSVIASIFWREDPQSKRTARIVKYLSLLNIGAVVWLEFALFADIGGKLLGADSMMARVGILLAGCFTVFYFTLKYGLRGFVFADLFHSPMLLIGVGLFIAGCLLAIGRLDVPLSTTDDFVRLITPTLSLYDCLLFAAHVLALNLLLVLVTESHWLRVWIFRERETTLQVRSVGATSLVWLFLIMAGFMSFLISGKIGEEAIVSTLFELNKMSIVFICGFWIGGVAALFSTADVQIFSFLLVNEFDVATGKLKGRLLEDVRPFLSAVIASLVFASAYFAVRTLGLPFEKIIFLIIPLSLNVFPAFVLAAFNRRQSSKYLVISIVLYSAFALYGLLQPAEQFIATLSAALMPIVVAIGAAIFGEREEKIDVK